MAVPKVTIAVVSSTAIGTQESRGCTLGLSFKCDRYQLLRTVRAPLDHTAYSASGEQPSSGLFLRFHRSSEA